MTYMDRSLEANLVANDEIGQFPRRQPILLVVEDGEATSTALLAVAEFLDLAVERVASEANLADILREFHPLAVIAEMDCRGQDGCHAMMTVAEYDRTLPIMLLTGAEAALAGAVDAVEETWQLENVAKSAFLPGVGGTVDFLINAGRKGHYSRMMPAGSATKRTAFRTDDGDVPPPDSRHDAPAF